MTNTERFEETFPFALMTAGANARLEAKKNAGKDSVPYFADHIAAFAKRYGCHFDDAMDLFAQGFVCGVIQQTKMNASISPVERPLPFSDN